MDRPFVFLKAGEYIMTFKRCFILLIVSFITTTSAWVISRNSSLGYITLFIGWMLMIWFALALFKGSEKPKPNNDKSEKTKLQ